MDKITKRSMAEMVCSSAEGITFGSTQQGDYNSIVSYLGNTDEVSTLFRPGPLMAIVALIVWSLTIVGELRTTLRAFDAVMRLPTRGGMPIGVPTGDGDRLQMQGISAARKLLFGLLQVARFAVATILLVVGGLYLVHTTNVGDLILNMVALEFVLNLDELIFGVMVPQRVKHMIGRVEPLPSSRLPAVCGLDIGSVASTLIAGVSTIAFTGLFVWP